MSELRPHPACLLLPEMTSDEFEAFKLDVSERGVLTPIVVLGDEILDGRHRWRACRELGIECPSRPPTPDELRSIAGTVLAHNSFRRHLSTSQRAAVAANFVPLFEAEAEGRMLAGTATTTEPSSKFGGGSTAGESIAHAAAVVGVSRSTVAAARAVQKSNPEAFRAIERGDLTVHAAKQQLRPKPPPIENTPAPVSPADAARDELGTPIGDERIRAVFRERATLESHAADIDRARRLVEAVASMPVGAHFNLSEVKNLLRRAASEVRAALPYAVCPFAPNCSITSCKTCRNNGWITKRLWDQVPPEMKAQSWVAR